MSPPPRSGEGSSVRTEKSAVGGLEEGGKDNGKVTFGGEDGADGNMDEHQRVAKPMSEPEGPLRSRGEAEEETTPRDHDREQGSLLLSRGCGPVEGGGARGANGVVGRGVDARAGVCDGMDIDEEEEEDGGVAGEGIIPFLRLFSGFLFILLVVKICTVVCLPSCCVSMNKSLEDGWFS